GANDSIYVAKASGVYAVVVTDSNGCSGSDTIAVTVNPLPAVYLGADTSICASDTVVLDAGAGFASYLWPDSSTNQTFIVNATGTYYVQVSNLCGTASDTIIVTVNLLPVVGLGPDTTICSSSPLTLNAGAGFVIYTWSTGENTQTIIVDSSGTYIVQVIDVNGCSGGDTIVITVVTDVNELSYIKNISIYPNPTTGKFVIEFNITEKHYIEIKLFSISGQLLYREAINPIISGKKYTYSNEIDLNLASGVYYLKIKGEDGVINREIVVE
ncbi:MAG: T9SS type A sorting domain-containing protein, partial [Bacteroidetes bacterium]|nr:T9SS type A sorting domain-containing protein [Bacteroidota bacterium]